VGGLSIWHKGRLGNAGIDKHQKLRENRAVPRINGSIAGFSDLKYHATRAVGPNIGPSRSCRPCLFPDVKTYPKLPANTGSDKKVMLEILLQTKILISAQQKYTNE
jgi:hypothetical protein